MLNAHSFLDVINLFLKANIGKYTDIFCQTITPTGVEVAKVGDDYYATFTFATPHNITNTTSQIIILNGKIKNNITNIAVQNKGFEITTERDHIYTNVDLRREFNVDLAGFVPTTINKAYKLKTVDALNEMLFVGEIPVVTQTGFVLEKDFNLINGLRDFTIPSPTTLKVKITDQFNLQAKIDNYYFQDIKINTGMRINIALDNEEIQERFQLEKDTPDRRSHLFTVYDGETYIDNGGGSTSNAPENKNTSFFINQKLINFSIYCVTPAKNTQFGVAAQRLLLNVGTLLNTMVKALTVESAFVKSKANVYPTNHSFISNTGLYVIHRYEYTFNVYENSFDSIISELTQTVPYNQFNMDFLNGIKIESLQL